MMKPLKIYDTDLEQIRSKVKKLGLKPECVAEAVKWARSKCRLWKAGRIKLIVSKEVIEEYLRVLAYPKFDLSEREIEFLLNHEILSDFEPITVKPGNY